MSEHDTFRVDLSLRFDIPREVILKHLGYDELADEDYTDEHVAQSIEDEVWAEGESWLGRLAEADCDVIARPISTRKQPTGDGS